jgi:DNA repair protein RadD
MAMINSSTLWDFQDRAVMDIQRHFQTGIRGVFLTSPTGSGKTRKFTHLTHKWTSAGNRVCIIAHRKELIGQASKSIIKQTMLHGIIQAGPSTCPQAPIQIVSIDSMDKRDLPWYPEYIIIDEAHLSTANKYQEFLSRYLQARLLLVSATPVRLDGSGFRDMAQEMVIAASVQQLVNHPEKILVPAAMFGGMELERLERIIPIRHGDFDIRECQAFFSRPEMIEDAVSRYVMHAAGLKGIQFCTGIDHSMAMCAEFNRRGIRAEHIDGKSKDRDAILYRHRTGQTTILCNANLLIEGYDDKSIKYIGLSLATESLAGYLQRTGRGLRRHPESGKTKCVIVDQGQNRKRHGHVMDDRDWSLYKSPKHDYCEPLQCRQCQADMPKHAYVCLVCGYRRIAVSGSIVTLHPDTPAPPEHEIIRRYRQLLRWAKREGQTAGWAHLKVIERFGAEEAHRCINYNVALRIQREEGF